MADLSVLIRLHKHELDEKRRALAELYAVLAALERQRRDLERAFQAEKDAIAVTGDIHFTFADYAKAVSAKKAEIELAEADLLKKVEQAKESMMETFAELKKYEISQEERERLEAEERAFKEAQTMDAIGLEGFRRKSGEDQS